MSIEPERIRTLLLQVWGEQACQRPADWPEVLARLMVSRPNIRGSIKPWLDAAVVSIAAKLEAGDGITGTDVWVAFSKLDHVHRDKLAALLWDEAFAERRRG